ncbi:MAG TPA: branched-chain amino acid aminotransferase [Candidatus Acidoferrum sp.]|nr:branched-chain amino acid aminotransferase [Candidatus Angelobacter sp.]HXD81551.1 branched-chain amino acid aminotransferase [Candidatus Acidoferrum sp.]
MSTETSALQFTVRESARRFGPEQRARMVADPGFGRIFSEHMVRIAWNREQGWHDAELSAYAPLQLDPAVNVLHYAQAVFEGLKAFRQADGTIAAFRPDAHAARFRRSARRLALPELPEGVFIEAIDRLLSIDGEWVPSAPEQSMYLRPFMFGSEIGLGVRPSSEVTFLLIASPSGSYFPSGVKPVTVWLSEDFSRAAPGGTGEAKTGGNYAGGLLAQAQASEQGCDQVVWLDSAEHRWVEEMGGMNLCFVFGSGSTARLLTPALTGTLLPGITRDSLLTLAKDLGYEAEEGKISTEEWRAGCADGSLTEVFACGTAAVITPVGAVKSAHGSWTVSDGKPGEVSMRLRKSLVDIQRGAAPDRHHWLHAVTSAV